ncbi:hypothetical protein [Cellulosilyticum sp. I15G10I2]|uniref:hypothetical protein n=1 Tax=Cellulosilyticum sp. I15G10I2 TaxID=1892843 RepID=UPI00085CA706|nr:hypothetical protein [Cellulosilyticum sp. I15G10I2]
MKKKLIAVIMTLLMLLGTVGCSTEGLNLYEEMKKTSAWEYAESKGNVLVTAEVQGQKFELGADFSGYANTKETQAYVEMQINTIKFSNMSLDVKMSPVKMYVDNQTLYISKTYFTELMQVSGAPISEALNSIEAEFIGIDLNTGTQAAMLDQKKAMALTEALFKGSEVKVPVTQNGRTYTIELNSDQMVDLSVQFIKEVMNNMDAINELSGTGVTQKDIDENKEEVELALVQGQEMVKPMLAGSKATLKYVFEDNTYKEDMDIALKFAFGEEKINLNMAVNADSKKSAKKDFKVPSSNVLYTMEEFMQLLMSVNAGGVSTEDTKLVQISPEQIITRNQEKYIPLRGAMSQLDAAVIYDAKTKKSVIITDNAEFAVNTIIEQGVSYIAVSELSKVDALYVIDSDEGVTVLR